MMCLLFVLFCIIQCESFTKTGKRIVVHYKNVKSADNAIAYGLYAASNYGPIYVEKSSIDPTITIWSLSTYLTDEYVESLIEYLDNDIDVVAVEEELTFYPTY